MFITSKMLLIILVSFEHCFFFTHTLHNGIKQFLELYLMNILKLVPMETNNLAL